MSPLEDAKAREVPWDEVREQRVLARITQARSEKPAPRRGVWIAGGLVAAAAAVALAFVASTGPAPSGSRLVLADGSEVSLEEGARIEIVTETETAVHIAQHGGLARYAVSHRPTRTFVVACDAIEVVVRGTRFSVDRRATDVEVVVEEGRVEVRHAGGPAMLGRGASLVVPLLAAPEPLPSAEPILPPEPAPEPTTVADRTVAPEPAAETSPRRVEPSTPRRDADALIAEGDEARRSGDLAQAARAFRDAIDALGPSPRAATVWFTLGRVERARGRHTAAAEAFAAAYAEDAGAILAEDALAEATVSWADAGNRTRAADSAARYAARYPSGEYVERVRRAAER